MTRPLRPSLEVAATSHFTSFEAKVLPDARERPLLAVYVPWLNLLEIGIGMIRADEVEAGKLRAIAGTRIDGDEIS